MCSIVDDANPTKERSVHINPECRDVSFSGANISGNVNLGVIYGGDLFGGYINLICTLCNLYKICNKYISINRSLKDLIF